MRLKQRMADARTRSTRLRRLALTAAALAVTVGCVDFGGKNQSVRTPQKLLSDKKLERLIAERIAAADPGLASSRVKVVSYDGVVLLVGQVPSAALRARAEQVLGGIPAARRRHNELQVRGTTNLMAHANDDWLTTKVVSRLAASDEVNANRVKVVVEDSVAYLVGIVPRAEADRAAELASEVLGVHKVVKVFEYLGAPGGRVGVRAANSDH